MNKRLAVLVTLLGFTACGPNPEREADGVARFGELPQDTASVRGIPLPSFGDSLTAADLTQIADLVREQTFSDSEFDKRAGDAQPIGNPAVFARVHPHKKAGKGNGLQNGKILGRVIADGTVQLSAGQVLPAGTSLWVLVQTGSSWTGVFVPLSAGNAVAIPMQVTAHDAHDGSKGRWVVYPTAARATDYGVWVTCDGTSCCCSNSDCDAVLE